MNELIVNAFVTAGIIALMAAGFRLIYHVAGFFHFALAASFTVAAYGYYYAQQQMRWSSLFAVLFAVALSGFVGAVLDLVVFSRLRQRKASASVMLLASIGAYVVLENLIVLLAGDVTMVLRYPTTPLADFPTSSYKMATILMGLVFLPLWSSWINTRTTGKVWRAVSSDTELAAVCGIDVARAVLSSFIVGSMLAGIAGVLYGIDLDVSPRMGMNALMSAMVAAVVGGFGSAWNLVVAAMLLSLSRYWAAWHFGAQWQETVVFVILIAVLILIPQGLWRHTPSERSL